MNITKRNNITIITRPVVSTTITVNFDTREIIVTKPCCRCKKIKMMSELRNNYTTCLACQKKLSFEWSKEHEDENRAKALAWNRKMKLQGRCVSCGKEKGVSESKVFCSPCRERISKNRKRLYLLKKLKNHS